jgi:hypothetical protein
MSSHKRLQKPLTGLETPMEYINFLGCLSATSTKDKFHNVDVFP